MVLNTIMCVPLCGFGNRLKFMASIKGIAKKLRIQCIKVVWRETMDCNITWQEVFKNVPDFELIDEEEIYKNKEDVLYFGYIHMNQILENLKEDRKPKQSILVIEGGHECKHPDVPILDYLKQKHSFYQSIEWADDIEERIKKIGNVPKVAIHYRHVHEETDQADVKSNPFCNFSQNSPFSEFEAIVKKCKQKSFFISNSGYHKNYVKDNISSKKVVVLHHEESNDRSSRESMKKSITEFVLMSRCELIIGSYYSSFSDEATYFSLIPKYMPMRDSLESLEPFTRNYHTVFKPSEIGNAVVLNADIKTLTKNI